LLSYCHYLFISACSPHHIISLTFPTRRSSDLDLAQYGHEGSNMLHSFLLDMYHAFHHDSQVTVFKNIDQCPQDLYLQMNQLVSEGCIKLDGRYSYRNGTLQKVEGVRISESFNAIEAKEQFLIFH